ncbi:dash complex subunit ask1 [Moniliophthora roreri MCA 2997]|uniref:DASH complex subunit ASK1 n=1 Tax=Moniliophthora roreri (strain MCA 2997) TaxID=1381753 RepID=V2WX89_MONRO|nr:dash complex subunit ask1 [Moniliophthora roreri MCA 2997]
MSSQSRRPIPSDPPRWQPSSNPESIQIPGLDTTAPPSEQIEQIEQLITLKLQNIDENFSKIHHILSTKILPAVKRYAVGTEPVRDAAKFWVSFYEQAAQIRIPTYEDVDKPDPVVGETEKTPGDQSNTTMSQEQTTTTSSTESVDESIISTSTEGTSFMPAQAAISSTPATNRHLSAQEDPPWTGSSLESPLVRLDRELLNFSSSDLDTTTATTTTTASPTKPNAEPLLRTLLRQRHTVVPPSHAPNALPISPLRPRKLKTPVSTKPSSFPSVFSKVKTPVRDEDEDDDDDDDSFALPPGMSPPRFMSPARPPRSAAELGLTKTPGSLAVKRITRDLVSDIQGVASGSRLDRGEHSVSTSSVLTPPSLSRYVPREESSSSGMDSSLESMMRRVGLRTDVHAQHEEEQEAMPGYMTPTQHHYDDEDVDEDSFFDDIDTAHPGGGGSGPSAAFLMASQNRRRMDEDEDDSFDRSDDSVVNDGLDVDLGGMAPVHPFARGTNINLDDSFDDDSYEADMRGASPSQETLFGVPPGQREQRHLQLHGGNVFDDTIEGLTEQIGQQVANSPTPAGGGWR